MGNNGNRNRDKRIADALVQDRKNLADKTKKKQQANVKITQKQANDLAKKQDKSQRKVGAIEKRLFNKQWRQQNPQKKRLTILNTLRLIRRYLILISYKERSLNHWGKQTNKLMT